MNSSYIVPEYSPEDGPQQVLGSKGLHQSGVSSLAERLNSEIPLDGRAKDVYGLGCLLAQLISGEHPYIRDCNVGSEDGWRQV